MSEPKARAAAPALLIALALPLAGCGGMTDDPVAATITAPGQYDLFDCPSIKVAASGVATRQRELEGLMARANQGPAGGFISATTYQPEYVTLRGKMSQLRRVAAENHCNFDPATVSAVQPRPTAAKAIKKPVQKRRNTM
jgi:hypothetical protein